MNKEVVGYIRVSTDGQVEDGVSLDAQKAKLAAWCCVNDCQLLDVHVDAGLSGGRADNRPGLQAAIDQACKIKGILVVYSLSRLARSTKDTISIGERLDKSGADLVSLSEKIDTTTASGKMVFRMLAVLAEFERDQISERTKMAMSHKRSQHERIGQVPYGFDLHSDGVVLVENADEQCVIGLIHELRARGLSLRAVALELEKQGIVTKSGSMQWTHTTIRSILARVA